MENELQVENGNYTRIVNPLIEALIRIPFKGCELAVALFIIRKTYGYNQTSDHISLTQIEKAICRSRNSVIKAMKNLELLNVVVKTCTPYGTSRLKINKYFKTWGVVNTTALVQRKGSLVNTGTPKLVNTGTHTKDKRHTTKDIGGAKAPRGAPTHDPLGAEIIKAFETFNPAVKRLYANTTQRTACDDLIKTFGLDRALKAVAFVEKVRGQDYYPTITTPLQLFEKWAALEQAARRGASKGQSKGKEIIM